MNLQNRIDLFVRLGEYLKSNPVQWQEAVLEASRKNPWFTPEFCAAATHNIIYKFLSPEGLQQWAGHYFLDDSIVAKNVGIVMAGNIPMVGFHDMLCVFICGHRQMIKLSSKDDVLIKRIVDILVEMDERAGSLITIAEQLKGCDAYIATGGSQSASHFEQYFSKYPNIIRRNRTSVAVLSGNESAEALNKLSEDIHLYFGLGCRNVTKLYVPRDYDFVPLLQSFNRYQHFRDYQKYANNYDYQLSILLLNKSFYMTNGSTLLAENSGIFSPISVVYYEFYSNKERLVTALEHDESVQCIVGTEKTGFGQAQEPGLFTYADGVDTMQFLLTL